jgi:hypothetical protein
MLLFALVYLGGVLTILSPCIQPVLPFVFARAGRPFLRNGLPILAGMAASFALVTLDAPNGTIPTASTRATCTWCSGREQKPSASASGSPWTAPPRARITEWTPARLATARSRNSGLYQLIRQRRPITDHT